MTSADFDEDGDQDLLLYDLATFSVHVWKNNDNLSFQQAKSLPMGPLSRFVQVNDIDDDGRLDLLTSKGCFLASDGELDAYLHFYRINCALVDVTHPTLRGWLDRMGWERKPIIPPYAWYFDPKAGVSIE